MVWVASMDTRAVRPQDRVRTILDFLEQTRSGVHLEPGSVRDGVVASTLVGGMRNSITLCEVEDPVIVYLPADDSGAQNAVRITVTGGGVEDYVDGVQGSAAPGGPFIRSTSSEIRTHVERRTWRCGLSVARSDLEISDDDLDRLRSGSISWDRWQTAALVTTARSIIRAKAADGSGLDGFGLDLHLAGVANLVVRSALALPAPLPTDQSRRDEALRFIQQHLADPTLGPERVAAHLGLSVRQLSRVFEGDGVANMITEQRLLHAERLLRRLSSSVQIAEVAARAGFPSPAHFSRTYRRRFGVTPREARASAVELVLAQN